MGLLARVAPVAPALSACVLAVVFLSAAVAKLVDPAPLLGVLRSLAGPSLAGAPAHAVAAGVVGWELLLAGLLFIGIGRRRVAAVSLATLALLSAVLVRLLFLADAPSCGCLGVLTGSGRSELVAGLIRNAGLLCLATAIARSPSPSAPRAGPIPAHGRRAFTLIELLVVIVFTGALIGLILPALAGARERARSLRAAAGIQQFGVACGLYTEDNRGALPFLATPGKPWLPIEVDGKAVKGSEYFHQCKYIANLLVPNYLSSPQGIQRDWLTDAEIAADILVSRYVLAQGAFAAPAYWHTDDTPDDLSLYRGMGLADIVFPSQKGLLLDVQSGTLALDRPANWILVALADGSAGQRPFEPSDTVTRPYGGVPWPVHGTRGGFAGRDW